MNFISCCEDNAYVVREFLLESNFDFNMSYYKMNLRLISLVCFASSRFHCYKMRRRNQSSVF